MGNESEKFIKVKGTTLRVSASNELKDSEEAKKFYKIGLKPADVAVLYPSFLCPALKKTGDALHFVILTDKTFHTTFEKSVGKENKKAGPVMGAIVNRYLKMVKWSEVDKTKPADKPLFDSSDKAKEKIEVHYLWKLGELNDAILTNKDDKAFAQMHPAVLKLYQDKGLDYGFEIIIKDLPEDNPGLYDLSWMAYIKKDDTKEKKKGQFYELQDKVIGQYNTVYRKEFSPLKCDVSAKDAPVFKEEETEIQSYHPVYISDKASLDIGHLSDVHVSSRQQVFTKSNARLIDVAEGGDKSLASEPIGPLVNTSFATLKDLMNQMGKETDLLIFTGDLIDYNRNYNPYNSKKPIDQLKKSADIWQALDLKNLTDKQQYPIGIDNLTMYELFKWYYKEHGKPIMLISGNHEAYTVPYGVSPRVKLTRSIGSNYFSGKWVDTGKVDIEGYPIYEFQKLTTDEVIEKSNKQAEKDRLEVAKKGPDIYFDRANEGIAADHNLTIPEAILMYGPDYARVVMGASSDDGGERNFKSENLGWFYHIFTPLSSYVLSYGDQCIIGLGWGDDERFVGKKQGDWGLGGFLPRSTQGVTDSQLNLVNEALKIGKGKNLLCSHFTYVNYNVTQSITEVGGINYNDTFGTHGKHDFGTFEENRYEVYKLIEEHKIHYTLSGHSHRSGLYQITKDDSGWGRYNFNVKGQAVDGGQNFKPKAGKSCMLVAACGGPIAVQNYGNEFFNWGLDYPSGNVIKADGTVGIKTPTVKQAKPRLAVALDYADIFLREKDKGGIFRSFESDENDGAFTIDINPEAKLPDKKLFKVLELCFYTDDKILTVKGGVTDKSGEIEFKPDDDAEDILFIALQRNKFAFMKLSLKASSNEHLKNYNTNSSWVYPVQLYSRKDIALAKFDEAMVIAMSGGHYDHATAQKQRKKIEEDVEGYIIDRHAKYGEVPNLDWYKTKFSHEYA